MWTLSKNTLTALLCVLLILPSPKVQADLLGDGMRTLIESSATAINEPGQYRSQTRNVMIAGGLDMRFPTRTMPALISVTPANLRFGCGGISAHFGGFSFINGEEIKNLIQAIAQNALGMAIELVITTLCGQCAHVMQVLRTLAKDAAKLGIDSCAVAQGLMQEFTSYEPGMWMKAQNSGDSSKWGAFCSENRMSTGGDSDWLAAASNACSSAVEALSDFQERASAQIEELDVDDATKSKMICKAEAGACNLVWVTLESSELRGNAEDKIAAKLILMSISGTTIRRKVADLPPAADGTEQEPDILKPAILGTATEGDGSGGDMDDVFTLFMCGLGPVGELLEQSRSYKAYCEKAGVAEDGSQSLTGPSGLKVYDCRAEGAGPVLDVDQYTDCLDVSKVPAGAIPAINNTTGYIPLVYDILMSGSNSVRNNLPLGDDVIGLINISPIPLYQALNVSAVYPEAAGDLLDTMTAVVAQIMAYKHIGDILKSASRMDDGAYLTQEQINNMFLFLGRVKAASMKRQDLIAQNLVLQEMLIQQIRALNMAMQKQVLTDELLGAQQFGSSMNTAVRE